MIKALSRYTLILHRYLGVFVGLLMTLWCLSGFVMMYQGFPTLTDRERLAGLAPLELPQAPALAALPFEDADAAASFRLEMLNGRAVLRTGGRGGSETYDLETGTLLAEFSEADSVQLARDYALRHNLSPKTGRDFSVLKLEKLDQWTIQTFRRAQPVYRIDVNDRAGTQLYVSGKTADLIQDTNTKERVLSWLGVIPHWLYPTILRQDGALWTQIVIWTSVAGTFLTVTGLYVGIAKFRKRRNGRWSPFRGLWYWHHMIGMAFGILTLTWVFSGLMTMNPWGLLVGQPDTVRREVAGEVRWGEVRGFIEAASREKLPEGVRQIRSVALGGELYGLARQPDKADIRLGAQAVPDALSEADVQAALAGLAVAEFRYLEQEDTYYYAGKDSVFRPAYRAILDEEDRKRIYIDALSGEVVRVVDKSARQSRWLRNGLHSLDFIRARPLWDGITLILLAGVTAVCFTGAWMSWRRIKRDYAGMRRFLVRKIENKRAGRR